MAGGDASMTHSVVLAGCASRAARQGMTMKEKGFGSAAAPARFSKGVEPKARSERRLGERMTNRWKAYIVLIALAAAMQS